MGAFVFSGSEGIRRWVCLTLMLVLCGCGGHEEPSSQIGSSEAVRQTLVPMSGATKKGAPTSALAESSTAASLEAEDVLDWASLKFPALFPGPEIKMEIDYIGVHYVVRAYPNANYLGVTASGAIFGLGPFTNNALVPLGSVFDYITQARADLCSVRGQSCVTTDFDYLIWGSTHVGLTSSLHVVDYSAPNTPRLTQSRTALADSVSDNMESVGLISPTYSSAYTIDQASRTATFRGNPFIYYVLNRQVYQIDLRRSKSTASRRISSSTRACDTWAPLDLDVTGQDSWITIREVGPDNDCSSYVNNKWLLVRTSDSPTQVPRDPVATLGVGAPPLGFAPLPDAQGRVLWLLGNGPRGTQLFRPDDLGPGPMASTMLGPFSADPSEAQAAYGTNGNDLVRYTWSEAGLSTPVVVHKFTGTRGLPLADASAVWFTDGNRVMRLAGSTTASQIALLPAEARTVLQGYLTTSHVILWSQGATILDSTLWSIAKAGGAVQSIAASDTNNELLPLGVNGSRVAYKVSRRRSGSTPPDTLQITNADGTGLSTVASGVAIVAGVSSPPVVMNSKTTDSIIYCSPRPGSADCANGELIEYGLASGVKRSLGRFTGGSGGLCAANEGWSGIPMTLSCVSAEPAKTQLWVVRPGTPGSLTLVATP